MKMVSKNLKIKFKPEDVMNVKFLRELRKDEQETQTDETQSDKQCYSLSDLFEKEHHEVNNKIYSSGFIKENDDIASKYGYVQFKIQKIKNLNKNLLLVQIIDISDKILHSEAKAE